MTTTETLKEQLKEFDETIGEIPDRAVMQKYGKEFCIMCGHPTKADETVLKLRKSIVSSHIATLEAVKGWAESECLRCGNEEWDVINADTLAFLTNLISRLSKEQEEARKML